MSATSSTAAHALPLRPGPRRRLAPSAMSLLQTARHGLTEAAGESDPAARYVSAHLAALRAAAALVATRGEPAPPARRRPRSVWVLLPQADPTLREWAAHFAAGAAKRSAAEAGLPGAVTEEEAADVLSDAEIFISVVETILGVHAQPALPVAG